MTVADIVRDVEGAGVVFWLEGEKVRVSYPDHELRKKLAGQIALLRSKRAEVAAYLKARSSIPSMPEGVGLVCWRPKPAPVILTRCEVVTEVSRFIEMTLLELRAAMAGEDWLAGHRSVRELVGRLEECGVQVILEASECAEREK